MRKWTLKAYKEHNEEITRLRDRALSIQATEYERRLDVLNHAHEEARRVLNTYIPRDVYEKDRETFQKLENIVNIELADRSGRSKGVITLFQVLAGISIVISVIVAVITFAGKS